MCEEVDRIDVALKAGADDRGEDRLRPGADPSAVASPDFTVDHGRPDGLFALIVGRIHSRMTQIGEDLVQVSVKKVGETTIGRMREASSDQPIQLRCQLARGHQQAVAGNLASFVTIPRGQSLLEKLLHRTRESDGASLSDFK